MNGRKADVGLHQKTTKLSVRYAKNPFTMTSSTFSEEHGSVMDKFFGLLEITDSTASTIYNTIVSYLNKINVPISNMIGLATDNASVMQGNIGGLKTKLQNLNKDLFYLGCTCHSLNLCSSAASKKLPLELEKLAKNVYFYFTHSSKRQKDFLDFQKYFSAKPHKILNLSRTCWLSFQGVVNRLIEQWEPLKHYFLLLSYEEKNESVASDISNGLNHINLAYFLFLRFTLNDINKLNKIYQSEKSMIRLIFPTISLLYEKILQNFIKPEFLNAPLDYKNEDFHLPVSQMFFGLEFQTHIEKYPDIVEFDNLKKQLVQYYIMFCDELNKRFDFANEQQQIRLLQYLDPKIIQKGDLTTISPLLKAFPYNNIDFDTTAEDLNNQWRSLLLFPKEKIINIFKEDIVKRWIALGKETNIFEELMFKELSEYMYTISVLPHSSAAAERIFSILNEIKNKKRNRLDLKTVEALIFCKQMTNSNNVYEPPIDLIIFYRNFNFLNGEFVRNE